MQITHLEPFFSGSHKQWALGFQKYSSHKVEILSLPGRHWKWRMHGGAVALAKQFKESGFKPDLILATSMLDLTTFLALTREKSFGIPVALYFHENQLTYPWSPQDGDKKKKRDNHYSFINYTSALVADKVFFNSKYHRDSFLGALPKFLNQFPDKRGKENIEIIEQKSEVLHLGLDLARFNKLRDAEKEKSEVATLLWNHRWEYDKNPEEFFSTLFKLKEEGYEFRLVVLGEQNEMNPPIFEEAKKRLNDEIVHWGYTNSFEEYARWLWRADILPVTSRQDFFGGSVIEAIYCNCIPILPNRLAYPEHIPPDLKSAFIYEDGLLGSYLGRTIKEISNSRVFDFQSLVSKYDWQVLINQYDYALESIK